MSHAAKNGNRERKGAFLPGVRQGTERDDETATAGGAEMKLKQIMQATTTTTTKVAACPHEKTNRPRYIPRLTKNKSQKKMENAIIHVITVALPVGKATQSFFRFFLFRSSDTTVTARAAERRGHAIYPPLQHTKRTVVLSRSRGNTISTPRHCQRWPLPRPP